jgi:hypothetical protein
MSLIKFLGLIMTAVGIFLALSYNIVVGGMLVFVGLVFLITPTRRKLTRGNIVNEFQHKMHALHLAEKEKELMKHIRIVRKEREHHLHAAHK